MKVLRCFKSSLILLALLHAVGCGSGSKTTENPSVDDPPAPPAPKTQVSFGVELVSSFQEVAPKQNEDGSFSPEESSLTLDAARVGVKRIDLVLPEGVTCADVADELDEGVSCQEENQEEEGLEAEAKLSVETPLAYDLFSALSTPELPAITVPPGTYRKVSVQIADITADDGILEAGDILTDHSLEASGTFNYQDSDRPFAMRLNFNEDIEIENEDGIEVCQDKLTAVSAQLDVEQWFAGINLTQCADDGDISLEQDGGLVIDNDGDFNGNCSDILDTIRENIKSSISLFGSNDCAEEEEEEEEDEDDEEEEDEDENDEDDDEDQEGDE